VLLLATVAASTPAVARADDAVGLVVFHGPASSVGAEARERAQAAARDARVAWLDLSAERPAEPIAPARLRAGIDAYEELRWDDALAALDEAAGDAWRSGGEGLTTTELSDIFLYRGLVHTQRGDTASAWDDLVRAAAIAPARTLDPARFPTRAVQAFTRAADAVAALPRATLTVEAPGCTVWIDGGEGTRAEVVHGEHAVRTECGSHRWGQRTVVASDLAIEPAGPPEPPGDEELGAIAKERAVAALIAVIVADGANATASVRVVRADGTVTARRSVTLDSGDAALATAIDELIAPETAPPPRPKRARWWQSRWLWAAGGAAIASAVILPLTLGGGGDGGDAKLRPLGWTW
jgi:hypothetical protein